MSYTAQSGILDFFTGGSGTSGTEQDKRPPGTIDPIKMWAGMKKVLVQKNGLYYDKSGTIVKYQGRTQPVTNAATARAIFSFWNNVFRKAKEMLQKKGRSTSQITRYYNDFLNRRIDWNQESSRFYTTINGVKVQTPDTYRYRGEYYMPFVLTDKLMLAISKSVVDLDNATWSAFNNMTQEELMDWAISNTSGGWLLRPGMAAGKAMDFVAENLPSWGKDLGDAVLFSARLIKWLVIGGIGFGAYWLYQKANQ